jgi:hypothetical protein
MKVKGWLAISLCACFFLSPASHAGGSVLLSDIQPLLQQQPLLWKFFIDRLDISPEGSGLRLGSAGIPLRGYRVGPYEFPAKMKDARGPYDLKVTITTDLYFLDANGKEVANEKLAFKKEEVLTGISLAPQKCPSRNGSFIQCAP